MSIDHAHEVLARRRATLAAITNRAGLADLLRNPPDELQGCPVHLLLLACPYIGDAKVRELCLSTATWPMDRLGGLPKCQRLKLARMVEL